MGILIADKFLDLHMQIGVNGIECNWIKRMCKINANAWGITFELFLASVKFNEHIINAHMRGVCLVFNIIHGPWTVHNVMISKIMEIIYIAKYGILNDLNVIRH